MPSPYTNPGFLPDPLELHPELDDPFTRRYRRPQSSIAPPPAPAAPLSDAYAPRFGDTEARRREQAAQDYTDNRSDQLETDRKNQLRQMTHQAPVIERDPTTGAEQPRLDDQGRVAYQAPPVTPDPRIAAAVQNDAFDRRQVETPAAPTQAVARQQAPVARAMQSEEDKRAAGVQRGLKAQGVEMITELDGSVHPKQDEQGRTIYKPAVISPFEDRGQGNLVSVHRDRFGNEVDVPLEPKIDKETGEKYVVSADGVTRMSLGVDQDYVLRKDSLEAGKVSALARNELAAIKSQQAELKTRITDYGTDAAMIQVKKTQTDEDRAKLQQIRANIAAAVKEQDQLKQVHDAKAEESQTATATYLEKRGLIIDKIKAKQAPPTFETKLDPSQESQFQYWKKQQSTPQNVIDAQGNVTGTKPPVIDPRDTGQDYDYRGAFKAGAKPDANGHWPDTFKKPNHPTFSEDSIYAAQAPEKAGKWDANGNFVRPGGVPPTTQAAPTPEAAASAEIQQSIDQQEIERNASADPSSLLPLAKGLAYLRNVGIEALSAISPEMAARVFGRTTSGLRPEEIAAPLISLENAKEFVGQLPAWAGGDTAFGQALAEGISGALSSFSAPGQIAQLPAFALPGVAETYVLNVLHGLPDQGKKLWGAIKEHGLNSKEVGSLAAEYGITDFTAFLAAKGTTAERFRTTQRDINAAPTGPTSEPESPHGQGPAQPVGGTAAAPKVPLTDADVAETINQLRGDAKTHVADLEGERQMIQADIDDPATPAAEKAQHITSIAEIDKEISAVSAAQPKTEEINEPQPSEQPTQRTDEPPDTAPGPSRAAADRPIPDQTEAELQDQPRQGQDEEPQPGQRDVAKTERQQSDSLATDEGQRLLESEPALAKTATKLLGLRYDGVHNGDHHSFSDPKTGSSVTVPFGTTPKQLAIKVDAARKKDAAPANKEITEFLADKDPTKERSEGGITMSAAVSMATKLVGRDQLLNRVGQGQTIEATSRQILAEHKANESTSPEASSRDSGRVAEQSREAKIGARPQGAVEAQQSQIPEQQASGVTAISSQPSSEQPIGTASVDQAAHEAATSPQNEKPIPSLAQHEADNAELGHSSVGGMPISFENPAGSIRTNVDIAAVRKIAEAPASPDGSNRLAQQVLDHHAAGNEEAVKAYATMLKKKHPEIAKGDHPWASKMRAHYGRFKGVKGADGELLDAYVKEGTPKDFAGNVYVINQMKKGGGFDETKSMVGYGGQAEAVAEYAKHYDIPAAQLIDSVAEMPWDTFKDWAREGDHSKPASATETSTSKEKDNINELQQHLEQTNTGRSERPVSPERIDQQAKSLLRWAKDTRRVVPENSVRSTAFRDVRLGGGEEHEVGFDPRTGRVVKITKLGGWGIQKDLARYLDGIEMSNKEFGDDIRMEGVTEIDGHPRIVISQPFYKGEMATEAQIDNYFSDKGFSKTRQFTYQRGDTTVFDARPRNVLRLEDGTIQPFDVLVSKTDKGGPSTVAEDPAAAQTAPNESAEPKPQQTPAAPARGEVAEAPAAEAGPAASGAGDELKQAIQKLPPVAKQVMSMRAEGKTNSEISAAMGRSEKEVETVYQVATRKLNAELEAAKAKSAPPAESGADKLRAVPKRQIESVRNVSANRDQADFIHAQAEQARQSLGPGAASSAEFPLIRAENAREHAAIGASHLLEGKGDKAQWLAAMREEYGIRDATPAELNQIWRDSHSLLSDFNDAQTGKSLRPKTQIEKATGIRPTLGSVKEQLQNSITKAEGLGEYLRGLEKGGKIGAEARQKQLAIADKWMSADQEQVRHDLIGYVNRALPVAERGRFIVAITRALRRPDLVTGDPATMYRNAFRVMQAIENRSDVVYKGEVIRDVKDAIERSLESLGVDVSYRQRIREATEGFGTTNPRPSTIESMKRVNAYIEKLQAAGEEVSADMLDRVSGLSKVPLSDLPIPALDSLLTKIQLLEKLGRGKVKSRKIAWQREKSDRVATMKASISTPLEKNPIFKPQPGESGDVTMLQRVGNWYNSGRNWFSGFEKAHAPMDEIYDLLGASKGTYDGWLERNIRGPLDLGYNAEVSEGLPVRRGMQEIISKHVLTDADAEMIQVHGILNMEGGKARLSDMGVSDEALAKAATLSPAQKEAYDYLRATYDSLLPRIQRTAHALDNVEVKPVENYVPLQRDWAVHSEADVSKPGEITFDENATSRQVLNDIGATRLSTKTAQGFTQSRVKNAVTAVRLNAFDIFNRHVSDALHYIHTQPDLRMAGEIARSPEFAEKFGKEGQGIILDHLDSVARQGGVNRFQRLAALDWARNATSKAQVGFRIASNLVHLSQIPLSITHAGGPQYWARGLRATLSDEGQAFLKQHAAETVVRSGGEPAQADVEALSRIGKAGFAVARNIDRLDAQATFLGRYFKEMSEKGLSADEALSAPVDRDAQMVSLVRTRRAVASPLYKDVPQAVSRGLGYGGNVSAARAVNQFRNIFLDNWSNLRHDFFRAGMSDAVRNGLDGNNASKIASIAAATIMSIAMETAIKYGVKQGIGAGMSAVTGNETEDKKTVLDDFKHHIINRVPFLGQAINAAIYGETGVPVIDAAVKPLHEAAIYFKSKKPETKTKHELRAAGAAATLLGIPGIGQAADIVQGLIPRKPTPSQLVDQVRRGDMRGVGAAVERAAITKKQFKEIMDRANKPEIVDRVEQMNLEHAEEAYANATGAEADLLAPVLVKKRLAEAKRKESAQALSAGVNP